MTMNIVEMLAYPAALFWGAVLAALIVEGLRRVMRRWEERR